MIALLPPPTTPPKTQVERGMEGLAAHLSAFSAARVALFEAITNLGLAKWNRTLTAAHQHAVDMRVQEKHQAEIELVAAAELALRAWRDR